MYMSLNSSHDGLQSAFCRCHSTETTLLQILNNIYVTISPSLWFPHYSIIDISCEFNPLHHDILIYRLEMIGINISSVKWLTFYNVKFNMFKFLPIPLFYGVPQGTVLCL